MSGARNTKALKHGVFIVFEGIDGSGKSTQINLLREHLESEGCETLTTREPTADSPAAEQLRAIAAHGREDVTLDEELQLFLSDRRYHVDNVVLPALKQRKIVLCDRYYYSTIAYQGALGADPEAVRALNEETHCFPAPHLVIYLRVAPEDGLRRIREGRDGGANVGYEKAEFLARVAEIYDSFKDPCFHTIPAGDAPEAVHARVRELAMKTIRDTSR